MAFPAQNSDGRPDVDGSVAPDGWIRLWRKALDSDVFADPLLWHLFSWCLLSANHTTAHVRVKIGRGETVVKLEPGQFLYGRKSAGRKLALPESTLNDRMKRLAAMGAISIQADTHYSIVSILKWGIYQSNGGKARHPTDTQPTQTRMMRRKRMERRKKMTTTATKGRLLLLIIFLLLPPPPRPVGKAPAVWPASLRRLARSAFAAG